MQYTRSTSGGTGGGSSSSENLPPRTLARLARQVRDLHKNPPEGVRLVVDTDSGLPSNLGELLVRADEIGRPLFLLGRFRVPSISRRR